MRKKRNKDEPLFINKNVILEMLLIAFIKNEKEVNIEWKYS